ncbi:hypothetical protein DIZ76_011287 [Coccidioides immitis]|uniref:Uncharacterized protein n=1 Tax=Coccidioides immitis RMSCC 2394 TaxID=404692 RepID=A0A0J6XYE3_COCIT|nr:hypothetical protein CIRG_01426 [Coccidioides immitis RMSCC 2394]TPX25830.1 hypothetical protein DIZ76_011287 [Coccidioides immitis]
MDEFAQTRGVDDLFDDEIIPVAPSQVEVEYTDDVQPYDAAQPDAVSPQAPQEPTPVDRNGGQYNRRRGNGGGRGPRGGLYVRGAKSTATVNRQQDETESTVNHESTSNQSDKEQAPAGATELTGADGGDPKQKEVVKPKVPAVRGDRSGTGGIKKPRLTEGELSERMAAVKIAAAKRAAAHARAEADEASFQQRERIAAERRAQERQNHRVMTNEREQNRQRKLRAQTGREWDAEKSQDTFGDRGRGRGAYRRGMHGGVVSEGHRRENFTTFQDGETEKFGDNGYRGRGGRGARGGRGRASGRGRGRGCPRSPNNADVPPNAAAQDTGVQSPPALGADSEFPALPGSNKDEARAMSLNTEQPSAAVSTDASISPTPIQGSWADHVDELHKAEAEAENKASQST